MVLTQTEVKTGEVKDRKKIGLAGTNMLFKMTI